MSEAQQRGLDLNKIPRERWARALCMILVESMTRAPEALLHVIDQGEAKFVRAGQTTDRYGITKDEYRWIFKQLKHEARRLGLRHPAVAR